jgi:hypothetical protein
VARIVLERARVGRRTPWRGVVAADLVQLGDLVQQLDLARRIEGVARHDLVDADLLLPAPGLLVDRLEDRGDRQLVLAAGRAEQALERGGGLRFWPGRARAPGGRSRPPPPAHRGGSRAGWPGG